ncbi:MAG TPA: ATP-binding protein [Solirubrobacterales bacterium]|jgi:anti-sigma regulatory factor (Ser/Thr protein kinase)|nr:ATP-binding protein [Solirubrobacterales bacterium]
MDPSVQLTVPARAENVAVVRHAFAGLAAAMDMDPEAIADLKTIVTEACMNVVVHAYEGKEGPLEVQAWPEAGDLVVVVRDYGSGVRPLVDPRRESLRLGLPLIAALAASFEISGAPGRGTEVKMRVPLAANGSSAEIAPQRAEALAETQLRVPAGDLVPPVLSRVVAMFAARADFSVDRLSDAILLSDAISAYGPAEFPDGTAQVSISEEDGGFVIHVGPLKSGAAQRLLDGMRIPELDASLEGLADEIRVEEGDGGERVAIRIANLS